MTARPTGAWYRSRSPTSTPVPASSGSSWSCRGASVWETDALRPIIARAETLTGRPYGEDAEVDVALRILADHARSVSFLISDGVFPSNEDRGYVLRRLIRRAVRQAYLLGVERPITPALVAAVVTSMGDAYPDLARNEDYVIGVAAREEGRFRATLRSGLTMLEAELASGGDEVVSGPVAFRLHDTHGFPIELTREIAGGAGRPGRRRGFRGRHAPAAGTVRPEKRGRTPTATAAWPPIGRSWSTAARPDSWVTPTAPPPAGCSMSNPPAGRTARTARRRAGDQPQNAVEIFLDVTPFYAEGGGQVGDTGLIETDPDEPGSSTPLRPCPD